jgi:DNA-binding transcriptional MerR regulator
MITIDDTTLTLIEKEHQVGLTSVELLDIFARYGIQLSEATLRKYVQIGLLPRSVRIGSKGKHRGSKGIYPVSVVRQILRIKEMMAHNYTIEQIKRDFLFMRSDMEQLEAALGQLFKKLSAVIRERKRDAYSQTMVRDVGEARSLSKDLMEKLARIEARLSTGAKLRHASAS